MRKIIITGASRGIGHDLSAYYAYQGDEVYGLSRSPHREFGSYHHIVCDITKPEEVAEVARAIGRVDVLINNAGIASMNHFLLTMPDTFESIFRTNVFGTFNMCQQVARRMGSKSHIINVSSVAVPLKLEGEMAYASSKAAVEMMTCIMATELAPMSIYVNAIAPAPMKGTGLIAGVDADRLDKVVDRLPQKKYTELYEIVSLCNYLMQSTLTGQVIYLGGAS